MRGKYVSSHFASIHCKKKVVENYKSVCNRFTMINGLILQVFGKRVAINCGI